MKKLVVLLVLMGLATASYGQERRDGWHWYRRAPRPPPVVFITPPRPPPPVVVYPPPAVVYVPAPPPPPVTYVVPAPPPRAVYEFFMAPFNWARGEHRDYRGRGDDHRGGDCHWDRDDRGGRR